MVCARWNCLCASAVVVLWAAASAPGGEPASWSQYDANPFVIRLDIPAPTDSRGGLIAADCTGDGRMDYLVSVPGHVAAYANDGRKLWVQRMDVRLASSAESHGLPGHHGCGLQVGDIDGDGANEVLFLTQNGKLHAFDSATGKKKWTTQPPAPRGADHWEQVIVCNLRGEGDRDLLLQATNRKGYRMGRFLAAYAADDLRADRVTPIWQRDDYLGCAHTGARVADLDGDGRDEVLGATILSPDGQIAFDLRTVAGRMGHLDSIFVADVAPDRPGLEVVTLEEGGGNRVFCFDERGVIWKAHHRHQEPQNAALGRFDPQRSGRQTWCRSRYNEHQKPFVFNADGKLIAEYAMDDVAPAGWTVSGVEVIWTIDWTGQDQQLAAAKERHRSGDVCIFDPITGRFIERFSEKADRLYVADVSGDWREELIVLTGNELRIYHNDAPNPQPDRPRLWQQPHYRRSKMTWNYYSP